jgi:hypothetical protein
MRSAFLMGSLVVALGVAAIAACSTSNEVTDDADAGDDEGGSNTIPPGSGPESPPGPAGSGLNTGLPCDVQGVLENRCIACHDGGKAVAMLSYDDLMKMSKVDPSKTIAQEALVRMKSTTSPMPPPPAVPPEADEIAIFEAWVNAGTPKGAVCTDPPPDGGTTGDGGAGDGGDGGTTATVCTSGTTWTAANGENANMRPGEACNACHQVQGGPNLRIAGTVYPTAHEPDDCNGAKPPIVVRITDKNNRITNININTSGNFSTVARPTPPFRATIISGAKTRSMMGSVTSGDCNSCHTVAGKNGAPGRIMAP